jgi:hypothetical protein
MNSDAVMARRLSRHILNNETDFSWWVKDGPDFVTKRPRTTVGLLGLAVMHKNVAALRAIVAVILPVDIRTFYRIRTYAEGTSDVLCVFDLLHPSVGTVARRVLLGDVAGGMRLLRGGEDPLPRSRREEGVEHPVLAAARRGDACTLPPDMHLAREVVRRAWVDVGWVVWSFAARRDWWAPPQYRDLTGTGDCL